jgi:hypothetical protein
MRRQMILVKRAVEFRRTTFSPLRSGEGMEVRFASPLKSSESMKFVAG